jgi:L-aspartate oxidase
VLAAARVAGTRVHDLETTNLLTIARVVVAAASARTESLGAHYRSDSPAQPAMAGAGATREVSVPC